MGGAAFPKGLGYCFQVAAAQAACHRGSLCRSGVRVQVSPGPRQPRMQSAPSSSPGGERGRLSDADLKETDVELSWGRAPAQGRHTLSTGQAGQQPSPFAHWGLPKIQ